MGRGKYTLFLCFKDDLNVNNQKVGGDILTWYVLFVRIGEEHKIKDLFIKEGLHSFVPMMKRIHHVKGKKVFIEKAMFPGYTFIESDINQNEFLINLNLVRQKYSKFIKVLKYSEHDVPALRNEEEEYLKRILNKDKVMEHSIGFIEGDRTIITEGPLMGLENTIIKIDRHKRKAIIQVSLCNQLTNISVSLEIINKI